VLCRTREVSPKTGFIPSNANLERFARLSIDAADTPVHTFGVSIREKILRKLGDMLAQRLLDSSSVAHRDPLRGLAKIESCARSRLLYFLDSSAVLSAVLQPRFSFAGGLMIERHPFLACLVPGCIRQLVLRNGQVHCEE
jgi:hypothetical protein